MMSGNDEEDGILSNFLFGNVDENGNAEIDYLDKDAREGLRNVKGQITKDMLQDVKADGSNPNAADGSYVIRNTAAPDYADEQELAEDLEASAAPPPALQASQQHSSLQPPPPPMALPAAAASLGNFLFGEDDDYDEPTATPAPVKPTITVKPPTAVQPVPLPAAAPVAAASQQAAGDRFELLDEQISLTVLGKSGQEDVLQISDVFATPAYDAERYLREPLVDEAEAEAQLQEAARARREARRQRRQQQQQAPQAAAIKAGLAAPTPAPQGTAADDDDDVLLLQQVPDDPHLLQQIRQQRALLLLPPASQDHAPAAHAAAAPGPPGARRPHHHHHHHQHHHHPHTKADGVHAAGLQGPGVVGLQGRTSQPLPHVGGQDAAGRLKTGVTVGGPAHHPPGTTSHPELMCLPDEGPLDPAGEPLVPATLQHTLVRVHRELYRGQAPPIRADINSTVLSDEAYQIEEESCGGESDVDEVVELLGLVPVSLTEAVSTRAWEQDICWGTPGDSPARDTEQKPTSNGLCEAEPMKEELSFTEVIQKSVEEALENGKPRAQAPAPSATLGVPPVVFGGKLRPHMLRLVTEKDVGVEGQEVKEEGGGEGGGGAAPAVKSTGTGGVWAGDAVPLNQPTSALHQLTADTSVLDQDVPDWEQRVLWDAKHVAVGQLSVDQQAVASSGSITASHLSLRSGSAAQGAGEVGASSKQAAAAAAAQAAATAAPVPGPMAVVLSRAAALPPDLRTPLLLDLNDPHMEFTSAKAGEMVKAAALVKAPFARPKVKYGPAVDPTDEVAKDLSRFNLSKDVEYGHGAAAVATRKNKVELRDASAQKAVDVKHAMPAATLITFPGKLDPEELVAFHRPRGWWHPSQVVTTRRANKAQSEFSIFMHTLTRRQHGVHLNGVEAGGWMDKSLAQFMAEPSHRVSNRFPEMKTESYQVWSVQAPRLLDVNTTFQGQGLADKEQDWCLIFPQIKVLPSREANQVPTLESNKPLRPPAAFMKKSELTAKEGHVILLEYLEERPALLGRPGMGVKLMTYYKKRDEQDGAGGLLSAAAAAPQQAVAEQPGLVQPGLKLPGNFIANMSGRVDTWRVGTVQQLAPDQESPFMGPLKQGAAQLSVETLMFRAPARGHDVKASDFLLIRSGQGSMSMREITGAIFVGQQQPLITVPDPQSNAAVEVMSNRLVAHVLRELRKKKSPGKSGGGGGGGAAGEGGSSPTIKLAEIMELFPLLGVNHIKKLLVEKCGCQARSGSGPEDDKVVYEFQPGAAAANTLESELRKDAPPDQVAAYESGCAAEYRLAQLGLKNPRYLANIHPDLVKMAIEMLPLNDPAVALAAELIEMEVASGLPWRTTEAFLSCVNDKSRLLNIDSTAGDPTGRGHGFAYVLRAEPLKPPESQLAAQPETGKITGSDSDLRKLSNAEAAKILLFYGISQEVINATTDRWKRIDMVRKLVTAQSSDGVHSELTRKYTRQIRNSFTDHLNMLRGGIGRIWDAQIDALSSDTDPPGAAAAEAMLKSLRMDRQKAVAKGITSAAQRQAEVTAAGQSEDAAEYLRMRQEGFFESRPDAGGAAALGSTVLEARQGERRIRRIITWKDGEGQQHKRELIISDKADMHSINVMCKSEQGGFARRVLVPLPPEQHKIKTVVPARLAQQEMSRNRGRSKGKGRGAGAGTMPASIRLPSLKTSRAAGRAKPRRSRAAAGEDEPDEAGGEDDDVELIEVDEGGRGSQAAAGEDVEPAKPKKPRGPRKAPAAGGALVCEDCGKPGHAKGSAVCKMAYVNPDSLSDMDDEDGAPSPTYKGTSMSRAERSKRRQQLAEQADSEDILTSPGSSGPKSRTRRAPREPRDTTTYVEVTEVRAKRKSAQAAVASFKAGGRRGGGGGDSDDDDEMEMELEDEMDDADAAEEDMDDMDVSEDFLSGDEDDDEELSMGRRGGGSSRRSGGAGGRQSGGSGAKRAAPVAGLDVLGGSTGSKRTRAFQAAAAAMSAADGQKALETILKECIAAAKKKKSGKMSDFGMFVNQVSKVQVPDYNKWVPESEEMFLEKILGRIKGHKYTSRAAFLSDVQQIVTNSIRYNSPGCGKLGGPGIIEIANALQHFVLSYLESQAPALEAAEAAIQSGAQGWAGAGPSTGGAAGGGGVAAQVIEQADAWVQCEVCNKWRRVATDYQAWVESQGDSYHWECKNLAPYTCDMPEEQA